MGKNSYVKTLYDIYDKLAVGGKIDVLIDHTLNCLGEILDVSHIHVFKRVDSKMICEHTWLKQGMKPMDTDFEGCHVEDLSDYQNDVEGEIVIDDASAVDDIDNIKDHGIKSLLISPIIAMNDEIGMICYSDTIRSRKWSEDEIFMIKLISKNIGNTFLRDTLFKKRVRLQDEYSVTKTLLENVMGSVCDAICYTDMDGKILYWNKAAEDMMELRANDVLGKSIYDLNLFFRKDLTHKFFESMKEKPRQVNNFEVDFKTKSGNRKYASVSFSVVKDKDRPTGIVSVLRNRDTTYEQHNQMEDGNSYYFMSGRPVLLTKYFVDKTDEKNGVFITRIPEKRIPSMIIEKSIPVHQMGIQEGDFIENLLKTLKLHADKNRLIFLDRTDYIVGRFGFDEFLRLLYRANNIIRNSRSVLLIYLNPIIFDKTQLFYLSQEFEELVLTDPMSVVPVELMEIMEFLDESANKGRMISMMDISKKFSITRPTTLERIKRLEELDMIETEKVGRSRVVSLTNHGRSFLGL